MRRGILIILGMAIFSGCGTVLKVTKLNMPPKQISPRAIESVEVFTSSRPNVPYTEVSLISSQQASEFSTDNTPEIIHKMRLEAANQGCDALIIAMPNDRVSGTILGALGGGYGEVNTVKGFHGTCVVYK